MKTTKTTRILLILLTLLLTVLTIVGCKDDAKPTELWENATYTEDTAMGEGAKTLSVTVEAGERSVVFTVKTDREMLGDALADHGLVDGEEGEFGLYLKYVNGIFADYDTNKSYWTLYIGEEYAMTGVDTTPTTDGGTYKLVYVKE